MSSKEVNRTEIAEIDCGIHKIVVGKGSVDLLEEFIRTKQNVFSDTFILADENTASFCVDAIASRINIPSNNIIVVEPGEKSKSLESLGKVIDQLARSGADRNALLISLGGGVVCDLSAFAAAIYKRGIKYLHIPTSLLGMIDAGIGGKNGINVNGIKNVAGTFYPPEIVIVDPDFLNTLPKEEWLNGYAEMIKHELVGKAGWLMSDLQLDLSSGNFKVLSDQIENLIEDSIRIKSRLVNEDPYDVGVRQALNLGHTIGHAIESASINSNHSLSHGRSVVAGTICELYISNKLLGFDDVELKSITEYILKLFGTWPHVYEFKDQIISNLNFDKKRLGDEVIMTLLDKPGSPIIGKSVAASLIDESLEHYIGLT